MSSSKLLRAAMLCSTAVALLRHAIVVTVQPGQNLTLSMAEDGTVSMQPLPSQAKREFA